MFKTESRIKSFLAGFTRGFTMFGTSFDVQHTISDELSSLEAMSVSHNMEKSHQIAIVGSCLFHKGTLIISHLSPDLTKRIVRFVTFMKLVNRGPDQTELIVIEQVYCPPHRNAFHNYEKPSNVRVAHTLIILAQKSEMLCVLLDSRHHFSQNDVIDRMKDCLERLNHNGVWSIAEENVMDISMDKKDETETQIRSLTSLTEGNVLLHYLSHTERDGVILLPTTLVPKPSGLLAIENRFIKTIEIIREVLLTRRHEERSSAVIEYGVHVEDNESLDKNIGYWIVGRLIDNGEFYVCYEDSVPQSTVEMAHRLTSRAYY
jgi:hypothetical protein